MNFVPSKKLWWTKWKKYHKKIEYNEDKKKLSETFEEETRFWEKVKSAELRNLRKWSR